MSIRRYYLRKHRKVVLLVFLLLSIAILFLLINAISSFFSTERKVEQVVERFYEYESNGDFSNSWELFHSSMKNRFDKSDYMQDRAHVFFHHFGVNTFDFWLTEPTKVKSEQIQVDYLDNQPIYRLVVTYVYQSKYGYLEIKQPVLVVEEENEWRILWEYEKD
ncbi:hypothetical protein SH601_00995 [Gracilibacillus sp. S3-1-1]|uniref:Uncharacterized protein n=1 Tax=Gracilibacillus pellucidus TaxID=3095368 RepID=A0ACC6M0T2_9BACI|nr:hypothetical protein [Gracilibacillus sp. S3-1-1]MDX8044550.1 hypothetical protein [Gracilibacillus sp. S3-1-1]